MSVTAVITTIPPRHDLLVEALQSVLNQTHQPDVIIVQCDKDGSSAATNRNAALAKVDTEWVAFLDDDDLWSPIHLEKLLEVSDGADLVYPWFVVRDGWDPLRFHGETPFRLEFTPEMADSIRTEGNFIPITVLARTKMLQQVGGFSPPPWQSPDNPCEDWGTWIKMLDAGAVFRHLPMKTWTWRHHAGHTSGRAWQ